MSSSPPADRPAPNHRFGRIGPDRIETAIQVLVRGDRAAATRFMTYARTSGLSLRHVWGIFDAEDRILATVLAAPSTGRTAVVFASRPRARGGVAGVGGLLAAAVEGLEEAPVDLAQALVEPGDGLEEALFLSGGFRKLAELDYLERPVPRFGSIPPPTLDPTVRIEPWDPNDRPLMIDLLQRTYENTLDCPGLAGLRRTEDILDGHLSSGRPVADWWHVLRIDDEPAGVLLFNRGADGTTIELVYLGLSTPARGRGFGRQLLTHGLSRLDGDKARTIVLAVDRANHPATALYRRAGFRFSVRRIALVKPVGSRDR